jgi:thiol-disulfide isomerase/thioredoxin
MLAASSSSAQAIGRGTPAPEIDLATLDGGRVKLSSLRGNPVLVTFWGTWCPPCREEFPELVAAHRKYAERGLRVLAVNQSDQELSTKDVQAFVKRYSVDFIVALDPRAKARRAFRLIGLPTTLFIDSSGVIQRVHPGPINAAQLADGLAMILPAK